MMTANSAVQMVTIFATMPYYSIPVHEARSIGCGKKEIRE